MSDLLRTLLRLARHLHSLPERRRARRVVRAYRAVCTELNRHDTTAHHR